MPLLVVDEIAEPGVAFIGFRRNTEIGITVCDIFSEGIGGKSFIGEYRRTRDIDLIQHAGCHGSIMNLSGGKYERQWIAQTINGNDDLGASAAPADTNVLVTVVIHIILPRACAGSMSFDVSAINADILHIRFETHRFKDFLQSVAFAPLDKTFIDGLPACKLSWDITPR